MFRRPAQHVGLAEHVKQMLVVSVVSILLLGFVVISTAWQVTGL